MEENGDGAVDEMDRGHKSMAGDKRKLLGEIRMRRSRDSGWSSEWRSDAEDHHWRKDAG
jgi:hypothetical protein